MGNGTGRACTLSQRERELACALPLERGLACCLLPGKGVGIGTPVALGAYLNGKWDRARLLPLPEGEGTGMCAPFGKGAGMLSPSGKGSWHSDACGAWRVFEWEMGQGAPAPSPSGRGNWHVRSLWKGGWYVVSFRERELA